MLTNLNERHPSARTLTYAEILQHYVWHKHSKMWKPQKQRKCIGRIVYSTPAAGERYFLRMLLNVVKGPQSFEELLTVNKRICMTFKEACFYYGLLNDDREWTRAIQEARNIMDGVDVEDLTIEQYLRLTQESQTPKKIEDMTIAEYLVYEKMMNMNHISNAKSYFPTYFGESTPTHDRILEFAHSFGPNQPDTESDYGSEDLDEEVEYMTDDEVVMSEQEESNHRYTQNTHNLKEKDDVDKLLNEMKDDIMKKQFEASTASISNETSSIASNEVDKDDNNTSNTASCQLPKELSPGSFLLLFNIDNHSFYAITTLDAKDNIMPLKVYEYLGLDKFKGTSTVENTTGTSEPLGTIDILVKLGTLEFLCNFVIKMADDVIILGRPFLESTRAQINVFNEEISFEIGSEKFKFFINSHQYIEKIYMVDIGQEEKYL
ncbi:ATP-dependent DNA helicase PIF1-like protein [Tanacetum coccineum]